VRPIAKSGCALLLASLLFLGALPPWVFGDPAGGEAWAKARLAEAGGPVRPVVLIDEPSFGRFLESSGYKRGKDLFEVHLTGFSDMESGALELSTKVKEVLSGAGHAGGDGRLECDIVASGLSGIIARYALESGYLTGIQVVNLVMASSPNRGTFLAGVVKSALEIVRQESILERETRAERFLPSLKDLFGAGDEIPVSLKELTQAKSLRPPEWQDEASWVSTRSTTLWEPLYAEYVKTRFLALPYVPSQSPKETFAGWVRRSLPDVWKRLIIEAEWPKSQAQDLSLPYYECLAMEVARNQYAMRTASQGSLVTSLLKDPVVPKDWKEAAIHYGTKLLMYFAKKALITAKAEVQEYVAGQAVKVTGLGSGPESPFIPWLVKEDLLVNLGTSSTKRFERIPANLALARLNSSSQSSARRRDTRYVSVVSRLSNPWALIWPQLGPNDSLLEVDCGVPPVGPGDLIAVFGGILRLPGKGVLDDRKAQEYVVEVLREDACPTHNAASSSLLVVDASSWRPVWCPVGDASKVTLGIQALPSGWQCQVWEEVLESQGTDGESNALMWGFDEGGTHVLRLTPGTTRLGFRLVRNGPLNPVMGNTVTSAFAQEEVVRVFVAPVELRESGEVPPPPAAGEPQGPPGSQGPIGPPTQSQTGDDLPEDIPIVRVVYRSKHTTLKKPKETAHDHWVLDFGDGSRETIQGEPSLSVDHTFQLPGHYEVTAESYAAGGESLYKKTWQASPVLAGETHRFSAQSIAPLKVNIVLNGPRTWVTGKPAVYSTGADIDLPPDAELVSVKFDPGEVFGVLWERAGDFVVGTAASIIVKYSLEDACVQVENTYLMEVPVTVLTTGVTQ
jgi:hypothetical protein